MFNTSENSRHFISLLLPQLRSKTSRKETRDPTVKVFQDVRLSCKAYAFRHGGVRPLRIDASGRLCRVCKLARALHRRSMTTLPLHPHIRARYALPTAVRLMRSLSCGRLDHARHPTSNSLCLNNRPRLIYIPYAWTPDAYHLRPALHYTMAHSLASRGNIPIPTGARPEA